MGRRREAPHSGPARSRRGPPVTGSSRLGGALALDVPPAGELGLPPTWPDRMRKDARRIEWRCGRALLFAADGIDWAADERNLVAVVGGLRVPEEGDDRAVPSESAACFYSAAELLARGIATGRGIAGDRISGAGLVVAIDLLEPRVAAYSTILSMHPLIWSDLDGGFCAASEPRLILPLLSRVEIDHRAVCSHLLFRSVPGEVTYLEGVHRLYPGRVLRWHAGRGEGAGHVEVETIRTLRDLADERSRFDRIDKASLDWLDGRMTSSTAAWIDEAWRRGVEVGNLLSGGLDSSLVQAWMVESRGGRAARSYSFAFTAPSFQFEVENARRASRLTGSRHHAPTLDEEGYLELLERSVEALGEPTVYNEAWPGHLALAEHLAAANDAPGLLFSGFGADTLHGVSELQTVVRWQRLQRTPRRREVLEAHRSRLEKEGRWDWIDALDMRADPRSLRDPHSYDAIAGEVDLLAPLFGEEALFVAFEARRELERRQFASPDLHESMQVMDLLSAGWDPTLAVGRLYAAAGIDVVQIYLDQEAVAAPFAFDSGIRFLRPMGPWSHRVKPLQQELLIRRGCEALVGGAKGGTSFNDEVWQWLTVGCLAERVRSIDQPWFPRSALEHFTSSPSDALWNVLTFDIFERRVVEPAAREAARPWRAQYPLPSGASLSAGGSPSILL